MVLNSSNMKLQPGKKPQEFSTCTLKELCPEDKQKVAKLVKQVVELGQNNQRLKDAAEKASTAAEEKVKQIQECNKQAVKENCSLKTKLGQAVTVLRMYHHKVQGLDAALRVMQNAAAAAAAAAAPQGAHLDQQQQQQQTQQTQQEGQAQEEDAQPGAGQVPAGSAGGGVGSSTGQQQQHSPGSGSSSPAQPSAEQPGTPASAAAERLQQQAQQLSDLLAQRDLHPTATAAAAQAGPHSAGGQLPLTGTSQKQQQAAAGPNSRDAGGEPLPSVAPLVLSPHFAGVVGEALQDLAAWQLQQGFITPGQAADIARHKVLQFDPSIGSHGAFVVQEPASVPAVGSSNTGTNTAAAQQAGGLQLAPLTLGLHEIAASAGCVGSSSRSSSAVPGLLDASPWESPTCKQLMGLAAAFDNLAAASTPGRTTASSIGNSPAAASVTGVVAASRIRAAASGSYAAAGLSPAAAAAAGAAAGVLGLGVPCECGVEEVPVEALNAAELPVLVQNKKSWSSLHAPSPTMGTAGNGQRPLPVMLDLTALKQQQHQQSHRELGQQQQPALAGSRQQQQQQPGAVQQAQGRGAVPWQQQLPQQQCASPQQQEEHSSWTQQQYQHGMQQLQHHMHGSIAAGQGSGVPPAAGHHQAWHPQQQQEAHSMWPAQQVHQAHQVPPEAHHQPIRVLQQQQQQQPQQQACSGGQLDWMQQPWPAQPLVPDQQQHWQQAAAASIQPLSRDIYGQPQQQCLVLAGADAGGDARDSVSGMQLQLGAGDARQLLERFDESLVDLLVEVERLEQQQQARRRQHLQQQGRRQQPIRQERDMPPQQQLGPTWNVQPGSCMLQQHQQRQQLLQQHNDQWRGQQQQQQLTRQEAQQQLQGEPGDHMQCWQPGAVAVHAQPEDDEVSDILNF